MSGALALLVSLGCQKEEAPPPQSAGKKEAPKLPGSETRFVQASTLKLRAQPMKGAKVKGRLAINYPLKVLEEEADFIRVKTKNGKEGWVGKNFVGKERVSKEGAMALAAKADKKERLSWTQRAAAVAPGDLVVLKALERAYVENDNQRAADLVTRLMKKLSQKWWRPRRHGKGEVWIEWSVFYPEGPFKAGDIPKDEWAQKGPPENEVFYVLPTTGPAIPAKVVAMKKEILNECAGDAAVVLKLDAKLPADQEALVVTRGQAPKHWQKSVAPLGTDKAEGLVRAAALAKLGDESKEKLRVHVAPGPDGIYARVFRDIPSTEDDVFQQVEGLDFFIDAKGTLKVKGKREVYNGFTPEPFARRDVDGDGKADTFFDDGCSSYVNSDDGAQLATTGFRCCGC